MKILFKGICKKTGMIVHSNSIVNYTNGDILLLVQKKDQDTFIKKEILNNSLEVIFKN